MQQTICDKCNVSSIIKPGMRYEVVVQEPREDEGEHENLAIVLKTDLCPIHKTELIKFLRYAYEKWLETWENCPLLDQPKEWIETWNPPLPQTEPSQPPRKTEEARDQMYKEIMQAWDCANRTAIRPIIDKYLPPRTDERIEKIKALDLRRLLYALRDRLIQTMSGTNCGDHNLCAKAHDSAYALFEILGDE